MDFTQVKRKKKTFWFDLRRDNWVMDNLRNFFLRKVSVGEEKLRLFLHFSRSFGPLITVLTIDHAQNYPVWQNCLKLLKMVEKFQILALIFTKNQLKPSKSDSRSPNLQNPTNYKVIPSSNSIEKSSIRLWNAIKSRNSHKQLSK